MSQVTYLNEVRVAKGFYDRFLLTLMNNDWRLVGATFHTSGGEQYLDFATEDVLDVAELYRGGLLQQTLTHLRDDERLPTGFMTVRFSRQQSEQIRDMLNRASESFVDQPDDEHKDMAQRRNRLAGVDYMHRLGNADVQQLINNNTVFLRGYRRVAKPGACTFCKMLAARTWPEDRKGSVIYQVTEKWKHPHPNCQCVLIPTTRIRAVYDRSVPEQVVAREVTAAIRKAQQEALDRLRERHPELPIAR